MFFLNENSELKVLGLSGLARSGKDYLAKSVAYRYGFMPLPMASHLKVNVAAAHPEYPIAEVFGSIDRRDEVRNTLQQWGTEQARDKLGENIWCIHNEAWMYHFTQYGYFRFIVPDVRFPNELNWIQRLGGKVVRVVGRGGIKGNLAKHRSETSLTDDFGGYDAVFDNSPDLELSSVDRFTNLFREMMDVG